MLTRAKKLAQVLKTPFYRRALWKGVAAGVEHESCLRRLSCKTVIDIGANRGQFALAVRRSLPQARIISFEPLPKPARIFRTVFAGQTGVELHEMAIGPSSGKKMMHIAGRDDSSSLLPITNLQTEVYPGTQEIAQQEIRVERLDRIISSADLVAPALLKMDVQGYEFQCLEGCSELLPHFRYLYLECAFRELYAGQALASQLIRRAHEHGFDLTAIYHLFHDRDGQPVDADLLFTRRSEPA
jgi:FkbM family methyltransferase